MRMSEPSSIDQMTFHAVDPGRWPDMALLFERRGGPKSCWCMLWRQTPEEARNTDGASRKAAMAARVAAGVPVGLLGYLDGRAGGLVLRGAALHVPPPGPRWQCG